MKHTQRTTGFGSPAESYAENDIDWNSLLFPKPHAMYVFSIDGRKHRKYQLCDKDIAVIDCSLIPKAGDLIIHTVDGKFAIGKYSGTETEIIGVVSRIVRILR